MMFFYITVDYEFAPKGYISAQIQSLYLYNNKNIENLYK